MSEKIKECTDKPKNGYSDVRLRIYMPMLDLGTSTYKESRWTPLVGIKKQRDTEYTSNLEAKGEKKHRKYYGGEKMLDDRGDLERNRTKSRTKTMGDCLRFKTSGLIFPKEEGRNLSSYIN